MEKYANKFFEKPGEFDYNLYENYLKRFPLTNYCSLPNMVVVRTSADGKTNNLKFKIVSNSFFFSEKSNAINQTELITENYIVYFKWVKPEEPNGIIFKYNIKLVDAGLNKVGLKSFYLDVK